MTELILWKNQQINKLKRDMDRLFNQCRSGVGVYHFPLDISEGPSIEISDTDDALVVHVRLPKVEPEHLAVSMNSNTLIIRGNQVEDVVKDGPNCRHIETKFKSFSRTFQLPCKVKVEEIRAIYHHGDLKLIMPKWKPEKVYEIKVLIK